MLCCGTIDVLLHTVLLVVSVIVTGLRLSSLDGFEVSVAVDPDPGIELMVAGPSMTTTRVLAVKV
jgi:hypothetical protein